MPLYELSVHYEVVGAPSSNDVVNVFNYIPTQVDPSPDGTAQNLVEDFEDYVVPVILGVMAETARIYYLEAFDVYNSVDFYAKPTNHVGTRTGDRMPRFVSWTFQTPRLAAGRHKRARKAIPFLVEGDTANGSPASGILAALTSVGNEMGEVMEGISNTNVDWHPYLVQKEKYTVPGSSPARFAYRYYGSEVAQLDHVLEIVPYEPATVSTQNSRKR